MIEYIILDDKKIIFNENQKKYINTLFNEDFTIRTDHDYDEFAFFGGWRSGKSFAQQLSIFLICSIYPNVRVLYVRDSYPQLMDSVVKQINDDFGKYGEFNYKQTKREFHFNNGSVIFCRAFDRDTNILSTEYDIIASCQTEDIKEDLFLQMKGRLSGQRVPKSLFFAEGNPSNTFVKKRYKDATPEELKANNIFFIETPTEDNIKNLPKGYIEKLLKTLPSSWINRYLYGNWDQVDEMVFSEFREHCIINPALPAQGEAQAIGGDYGWRSPSAFIWGFRDFDGNYIIYDEFYAPEKTPEELQKENIRHGQLITVMDYSTKRPDSHGKSVWDMLQESGMWLIESNKDELRNIVMVNTLFKTGRLKICRNCINLIREIKSYKWEKQKVGADKNASEKPIDKDNHTIDALLYLIAYLEDTYSEVPQMVPREMQIRHYVESYDDEEDRYYNG